MPDFSQLFNQFGNNPFSFEDQSYLYESNKPIAKGESINYLGLNYVCQADVQAGSKILLVKDGLLAIPEILQPANNPNERVVLERRVSGETPLVQENLSLVWGLDGFGQQNQNKPYYYLYDSRRKRKENLDLPYSSFSYIYVDPLDRRKKVSILGLRYEGSQVKFVFIKNRAKTVQSVPYFFINDFALSICNSWFWVPGERLTNTLNPDFGSGKIIDFSNQVFEDSMSLTYTGSFGASPVTEAYQIGTMRHLIGSKDLFAEHSYLREQDFVGNSITRTAISSYSKPKLADIRNKKVISYDSENITASQTTYSGFGQTKKDFVISSSNLNTNSGGYLYDYSLDLQNPTKTKVNTSGPHVISLWPTQSGNGFSNNFQMNYSVGDSISCTFPEKFQGHGYLPTNGSSEFNGIYTQYTGTISNMERANFVSYFSTPILNAYGWLPTTDGKVVGVKGRITSLQTDDTDVSQASNISNSSVQADIYRQVTFVIESIEVPKTTLVPFQARDTHSELFPSTLGYPNLGQRLGWLKFGNSFQNLNADAYDKPLNYLLVLDPDLTDAFTGSTLSQDGFSNRYWWKGDYIWHLTTDSNGVGTLVSQIYSKEDTIHIPRYKLNFNSARNWYDFVFEAWEEFMVKGIPGSNLPPSELYLTDLTITPPSMPKAARGL
jgi:hypothetical protein